MKEKSDKLNLNMRTGCELKGVWEVECFQRMLCY